MGLNAGKILGVWALILGLLIPGCARPKTLTILHTNDTHSALLPFGHPSVPGPSDRPAASDQPASVSSAHGRAALIRESGGIARMATLIKKIRTMNKNVLALNAGDVFVGSFEFNKYLGYPELKIMENLYDAMSLGNHEFDLGLDGLAAVVSGQVGKGSPVTLPLLCANIDFTNLPLAAMIQKSIIRKVGGVQIGVFGIVNEDAENYSREVIGRFSGDVYEVAGSQAGLLRAAGCEVVICLSHLGTTADLTGLADKVPGIDVIVGGHSHDLFENAILRNGKIIVQAGEYGRYLGELKVNYERGRGVRLVDWRAHPVDSRIKPDTRVEARLNELREGVIRDPRFGPVYSRVVALADRDIEKDWPKTGPNRDGALGNLITDAMGTALKNAGLHVDCALDVFGNIATSIQAGKVVGADVLRAVPYGYDPVSGLGFKLVLAALPGSLILGGLEYSTSYLEYTTALSIQASGLTFTYDSSRPRSQALGQFSRLDLNSVMVGGKHIDPNGFYNVVMTEQVFNFLNNLVGGGLVKIDTGIFEYNALRDYMSSPSFVVGKSEGRVKDMSSSAAVKQALR